MCSDRCCCNQWKVVNQTTNRSSLCYRLSKYFCQCILFVNMASNSLHSISSVLLTRNGMRAHKDLLKCRPVGQVFNWTNCNLHSANLLPVLFCWTYYCSCGYTFWQPYKLTAQNLCKACWFISHGPCIQGHPYIFGAISIRSGNRKVPSVLSYLIPGIRCEVDSCAKVVLQYQLCYNRGLGIKVTKDCLDNIERI